MGAWELGGLLLAGITGLVISETIKNIPPTQGRVPSQSTTYTVEETLTGQKARAESAIQTSLQYCDDGCAPPHCMPPFGTLCFCVHQTPPSAYDHPCNILGVHIGHVHMIYPVTFPGCGGCRRMRENVCCLHDAEEIATARLFADIHNSTICNVQNAVGDRHIPL